MAGPHRHELPAPPEVLDAQGATEVLRAWIVGEGLHVSIQPAFEDPSVWGLLLVDVARHAARAYAAEGGCTEAEALERILAMWRAEISSPTDLGQTSAVDLQ